MDAGTAAALGRALLAIVLGLAAWAKLRDWGGLRGVLRFLMPRVPVAAIVWLAATVVGLEAILAALLVSGFHAAAATWATVAFLGAATAALLLLRRRGYQGGCACFGYQAAARPVGALDFVRNAFLIAVSFAITQSSLPAQPLWTFPAATIALLVATAAGVLLSYGMIAAVVAVRGAGAPGRSEGVAALAPSRDEAGGREA